VDLDYKIFSEPNRFFKRSIDLCIGILLLPLSIPLLFYILCHPSLDLRKISISDGIGQSMMVWQPVKKDEMLSGWLRHAPLFWEVLRGRMSLVGTEIVPFGGSSHAIGYKPGLTGLVQVNRAKALKEEEKELYTLYYLRNYSIFMDLEIIWRTLFHV